MLLHRGARGEGPSQPVRAFQTRSLGGEGATSFRGLFCPSDIKLYAQHGDKEIGYVRAGWVCARGIVIQ
jgi:hypothetical protein